MKPNLPPWLKIDPSVIVNLDAGAQFKPLTKADLKSGIVARGPLVAAATQGTNDAVKRELPALCHNVGFYLDADTETWFMFHDSSPMVRRNISIEPLITVNRKGELIVSTLNHGLIRYRRFKAGDKVLYDRSYDDYTEADDVVRDVWRGEWLDGHYGT